MHFDSTASSQIWLITTHTDAYASNGEVTVFASDPKMHENCIPVYYYACFNKIGLSPVLVVCCIISGPITYELPTRYVNFKKIQ